METTKRLTLNFRIVAAAGLALVILVALGGIAFAKPGHGHGASAQYQYGPGDHEYGPSEHQYGAGQKATICRKTRKGHRAKTLTIGAKGAAAHLRHHRNDHAGACTAEELANTKHGHGHGNDDDNDHDGNDDDNDRDHGNGQDHDDDHDD